MSYRYIYSLVELIVLNVGLQAGILDTRVFSMFVVHAIILTFITTPLTLMFYPSKYRVHTGGAIVKGASPRTDTEARGTRPLSPENAFKTRFAVVLNKTEQLPAAMTLASLLHPFASGSVVSNITVDALRLIELTTRTSAVLKSTESSSLLQSDSVLSVFRTFGQLNKLLISAALSIVPHDEFATAISTHVSESETEMVILPWSRGSNTDEVAGGARNPFDGIFHKYSSSSVVYSEFIRRVFMGCPSDVELFIDCGPNLNAATQQFFLPFFGGPDDRLALSFLVQLCVNPDVKAIVVRVVKTDNALTHTSTADEEDKKAEDVLPSLHYVGILHLFLW